MDTAREDELIKVAMSFYLKNVDKIIPPKQNNKPKEEEKLS